MHNKRGITPLIATVLLIGLTIIIALIVYAFVTNFAENQVEDTENEADISLLCAREVNLETEYCGTGNETGNDLTITLKNRGEIDFSDLSIFVDVLGTTEPFPNKGQLMSYVQKDFQITLDSADISHITEITIVPVITSGTNTGNCPEEIIEVNGNEIEACEITSPVCGDGFVTPPEFCDTLENVNCVTPTPICSECTSCI